MIEKRIVGHTRNYSSIKRITVILNIKKSMEHQMLMIKKSSHIQKEKRRENQSSMKRYSHVKYQEINRASKYHHHQVIKAASTIAAANEKNPASRTDAIIEL